MNRILKRPMFRIGGSAGTGITSGLDKPRKQYANGTEMPNFQPSGLPGFLTSFGLNLLATPPRGNIFQTAAVAAQDPFRTLQAQQASRMKTASDRAFAKELAKEEREFDEGQLTRKLQSAEKIAGMDTTKTKENLLKKYDNNEIKAQREQDFYATEFDNLRGIYGNESVAIETIDSSEYQKKGSLEKYVKQNPQAARQVIYDVATGKAMRIVKDQTGKFTLVPADSADIDTTGEDMPKPVVRNPGYLRPPKDVPLDEPDFGIGFYD